jgi:H+-transporting ATPase
LERQTEQLGKKVDRHPDETEKKPLTLAPKSDEPTVLIPIEQQIRQRAYELYEQRGRTDGQDLDDWLQAEREIKGTQANAQRHSFRQSSRAVGGSAGLVVGFTVRTAEALRCPADAVLSREHSGQPYRERR